MTVFNAKYKADCWQSVRRQNRMKVQEMKHEATTIVEHLSHWKQGRNMAHPFPK